ncbi:hypothetical protein [Bradyrhizobium archetypum]|uniref:hypothetical protein n=1 Tax=Bradyrhizobium archetypum TaxID=2721160 RepID=UPI0014923C77|nr:hypothetical protein [Bradyrhizobium archetypum]
MTVISTSHLAFGSKLCAGTAFTSESSCGEIIVRAHLDMGTTEIDVIALVEQLLFEAH